MLDRNMMSKTEQIVYFYIDKSERKLLSLDVLYDAKLCEHDTLKNALHRLVAKKWLIRIKRGWYAINEPENNSLSDTFFLATIVFNGYVAFSSALYVYGALDEIPYTVFVATETTSTSKRIGSMDIKAVAMHSRFTGVKDTRGISGYTYPVSTRAKTLYDCLYLPRYSGGYSNILQAIPRLMKSKEDWEEFSFYSHRFGTVAYKRRIGYLLWLANKRNIIKLPKHFIENFNEGNAVYKLGSGKNGKYIKEWKLVSYINEEELLGKVWS